MQAFLGDLDVNLHIQTSFFRRTEDCSIHAQLESFGCNIGGVFCIHVPRSWFGLYIPPSLCLPGHVMSHTQKHAHRHSFPPR